MHSSYPEEITDKTQVLTIQVLIGGLLLSAWFYAIIIIASTIFDAVELGSAEDAAPAQLYTFLTFFTLIVTAVAIPVSSKLFRSNLNQLKESGDVMTQIRTAYVLRFAVLEGAALLGLTILFLAAISHQNYENSLIWLNIFPFMWLILASISQFPTAERIKQVYTEFSTY